ncbi:hypothetical protein GCM10022247_66280 [Allokutzneria multivorans]|uniref:Uncharacterized protein n=1 Tax=Allokutzneria multivorans TaxID=1142134 RepID=A0ABP7TW57_9PSEU
MVLAVDLDHRDPVRLGGLQQPLAQLLVVLLERRHRATPARSREASGDTGSTSRLGTQPFCRAMPTPWCNSLATLSPPQALNDPFAHFNAPNDPFSALNAPNKPLASAQG